MELKVGSLSISWFVKTDVFFVTSQNVTVVLFSIKNIALWTRVSIDNEQKIGFG